MVFTTPKSMEGLPLALPKISVSPSAFCEDFEWNFCKIQQIFAWTSVATSEEMSDFWDVISPGGAVLILPSISTPTWAPVNSRVYHDSFGFAWHGKHTPSLQLLLPFLKRDDVHVQEKGTWAVGGIGSAGGTMEWFGLEKNPLNLILSHPWHCLVGNSGLTAAIDRRHPTLPWGQRKDKEKKPSPGGFNRWK